MEYSSIKDALTKQSGKIKIRGWCYRERGSKAVRFIVMRDSSEIIQCVFDKEKLSPEIWEESQKIKMEASFEVSGELAKNEKGVTGLTMYMLPENPKSLCGSVQNLELTAKVKAKLIGDKDIWSTNVDVKTMQCITVLWGLVGSKIEISKAIAHAKSVKGVTKVKSFLKSKK